MDIDRNKNEPTRNQDQNQDKNSLLMRCKIVTEISENEIDCEMKTQSEYNTR